MEHEVWPPNARLPDKIHFFHITRIQDRYPDLTPTERECNVKNMGCIFVISVSEKT